MDRFQTRAVQPASWRLAIHCGDDRFERFRREGAGHAVVIAGRNRPKIELILGALESGMHVLADKPWIIDAVDFPRLEQARIEAESRSLVAWDMMTERHDTTNRIQIALTQSPEIFGTWTGDPALTLESVHCLKKTVSGTTLRRPIWWFDESIAGQSIADVGTHLVDLAVQFVAPNRWIDAGQIAIRDSLRWPLTVSRNAFEEITGQAVFPQVHGLPWSGEELQYAGNNSILCSFQGIPIRITTRWELERPDGDWHEIVASGTRSTITASQDSTGERMVRLRPVMPDQLSELGATVRDWCRRFQHAFPGVDAFDGNGAIQMFIPRSIRRDHEMLFDVVFDEFLGHIHNPTGRPAWDWSNRLARYSLTTQAVSQARAIPSEGDPLDWGEPAT